MATPSTPTPAASPATAAPARTRRLLEDPIGPTLAALAAPNIVVSAAQMAVAVADAWYVGFLGVAPLAALALVFPVQSLMTMMSAGAMGGGISSAMARALGARRPRAGGEHRAARADHRGGHGGAVHDPVRPVRAAAVRAARRTRARRSTARSAYARIMFGGAIVVWAANTLASLLRGTGNMAVPGVVFTRDGDAQRRPVGRADARLAWGCRGSASPGRRGRRSSRSAIAALAMYSPISHRDAAACGCACST